MQEESQGQAQASQPGEQDIPEEAKAFLRDVEEFQQKILEKYPGALGLAIITNWSPDQAFVKFPRCILETDPEKVKNIDPAVPAMMMHDLLVNSGSTLMKQLLQHASHQISALRNKVDELQSQEPAQ